MKKVLVLMLLVGGSAFAATRVSVHIGVGAPAYVAPYYAPHYAPAPPPVVVVRPPYPGPGYVWVDGYWSSGVWIGGYWARPYHGYRVAPRYYAPRYVAPRRGWDRGYGYRHR